MSIDDTDDLLCLILNISKKEAFARKLEWPCFHLCSSEMLEYNLSKMWCNHSKHNQSSIYSTLLSMFEGPNENVLGEERLTCLLLQSNCLECLLENENEK